MGRDFFNQRPIEQGVPLYKFGSTDSETLNLGIKITQQVIKYTYTCVCIITDQRPIYSDFAYMKLRIVTANSYCCVVLVNDSII